MPNLYHVVHTYSPGCGHHGLDFFFMVPGESRPTVLHVNTERRFIR